MRASRAKENSRKDIPTEKKRKRLIDGFIDKFCNTVAKTNKKIETQVYWNSERQRKQMRKQMA
jgi:hypothetical protein